MRAVDTNGNEDFNIREVENEQLRVTVLSKNQGAEPSKSIADEFDGLPDAL